MHTQTHIHIPNSNLFCQYNITCVYFQSWMPNQCALLWREIPLPLPVFSVDYKSLHLVWLLLCCQPCLVHTGLVFQNTSRKAPVCSVKM